MTSSAFPRARADALASKLDIGLDIPICLACLSLVAFAVDADDPVETARQTRRLTPVLWDEGLSAPALDAVRRACECGVQHAREGLVDLERRGGGSAVARAIVLRLAEDLAENMRAESCAVAMARDRLRLAPAELN